MTMEASSSPAKGAQLDTTDTHVNYEKELQEYIDSAPFKNDFPPDTQITRRTFELEESYHATHMIQATLATSSTIPVAPVVFHSLAEGKMWAFFRLGAALAGHPNICHGGFVATLLDEVMGVTSSWVATSKAVATRELTITYTAPVPTNSCIMVKAWLEKEEGRKIWMRGSVEDVRDEKVFTEAKALFIKPREGSAFYQKDQ